MSRASVNAVSGAPPCIEIEIRKQQNVGRDVIYHSCNCADLAVLGFQDIAQQQPRPITA